MALGVSSSIVCNTRSRGCHGLAGVLYVKVHSSVGHGRTSHFGNGYMATRSRYFTVE